MSILFIIKIVHEVQQEKLKYTKETEQYTALRYQSLYANEYSYLQRAIPTSLSPLTL